MNSVLFSDRTVESLMYHKIVSFYKKGDFFYAG